MNEFNSTLAAFLAGQTEFARVESELVRSLEADPSVGPAAFAAIDQLYKAGRLPLQLYVLLKNHIAQSHAAKRGASTPRPPAAPQPASAAPHAAGASAPQGRAPAQSASAPQPAAPAPPAPPGNADPPPSDRTMMRARPAPRPAGPAQPSIDPSASQPGHSASGPRTGGFAATGPHTGGFAPSAPHAADASHTGAPFTSRTGTGATGTGTGTSSWADLAKLGDQPSQVLERGSVLKGRFVLENVIGRGGMGVVFRAKDLRKEEAQDRDPYVAIKILNDEFRRHPESLKALQREARKSQNLAHPNIVNVFDFDRDGGTVYMTMEFLQGESLDRIIKNPSFEGMSLEQAYPIITGLGSALSYAHQKNIVHSDFKPGNCFLTKSGVVKVFDFGIAQAAKLGGTATHYSEHTKFDPGTLGALTPAYASCEMIAGAEPDQRDDIYAFGCVIYELLTGKHPFNKKSAVEARDEKLSPQPIKHLTRRQWRALEKSLAFDRAARSASVNEVVEGLGEQKFNAARALVALAAVLVLAVVGYVGWYVWQEQQTATLLADLQSGEDARVTPALDRLGSMDLIERTTVLQEVREPLIDWYERWIRAAIDAGAGRYEYPEAERGIAELNGLYPDSARIDGLRSFVNGQKGELLEALDARFNANIDAGRLLPDPNADDLPEVLSILAVAEPNSTLLTDSRIAHAYGMHAEEALAREDFNTARTFIELGLERFPDDAPLRNTRDRLAAELQAQQNALRLAELNDELAGAARLTTVAELRALEGSAAQLGLLDPNAAALNAYRARVAEAAENELRPLLAERAWPAAEQLADSVAGILSPDAQDRVRALIAEARGTYDTERNSLLADLNAAASGGRFAEARQLLDRLTAIGADATTLRQATNVISGGYVTVVQRLVDESRFDDANAALSEGLELDPESSRLLQLRDAVAEQEAVVAERGREEAERQRLAAAQTLRSNIEAVLNQPALTIGQAEEAVGDADRLALLAPDDPLAGTLGQERIARKLADQAAAMGASDRWDEAVRFLDDALARVTNSDVLRTARAEAVSGQSAARAAQQQERVAQQRQAVDALLAAPRYDAAWISEVRERVASLRTLVGTDDASIAAAERRAAELLVARSAEMREAERFDEAERLLGSANSFAPQLEALAAERRLVAEARARWEQENAAERAAAQIEGLKQTFMARVNNQNIPQARAALDDLRRALPANDAFLTTTAPQALADVYARLARNPFEQGDFARADQLVTEGLREWQESPTLRQLSVDIRAARESRLQANLATLGAQLDGGAGDVNAAKALLTTIESDAGAEFAALQASLIERAQTRISANPRDEQYVRFASAVFAREFNVPPPPRTGQQCIPAMQAQGRRPQGRCFDLLPGEVNGPTFVVVPPGGGQSAPFAIGRTEVTIEQWNYYCRSSGQCTEAAGNGDMPVTGIAAAAAEQYAAWLTAQTSSSYRLPTAAEWEHAASAPRTSPLSVNCVTMVAGSQIRGGSLQPVGQETGNDWGVTDYLGNVQEWVKVGAGYEARGGDYRDRLEQCREISRVETPNPAGDELTGFRLVRALGGGSQ